jgi:hypothetical protein
MTRVLLFAALLMLTQACFLVPKKKSAKGGGAAAQLVVREGIFLDRTGDGDAARLSFKTKAPAICELSVYSQDDKTKPTKDDPKIVPCSSPDAGRTDITEKIDGLKTDALYYVVIRAWPVGGKKETGDSVLVKEAPNPASVISPGDPVDDGKLKDLLVARMDLPLKTVEVHHHQLPDALDTAAIKGKLTRTAGCQVGVPDKAAPFRDAVKDIAIKNLATKDLGAGTAGPHKDYPERLSINYGSLNDGLDRWTLMYQLNGKDFQISARPVSRILNMEMESGAVQAFDAPQLAEAADALKLDTSKPLKLSWTTGNNLLDLTYMTIQIGRPDDPKAVYCIFPAEKRSAEVDAKLLQGLEDGKYVVLAELTTNQLFAKEGWLVSTYDWRSGRIEK